jgi:hypothetical protein
MKIPSRFTEALDARREEWSERAEMSREELAQRAAQIREQFAENVTQEAVTTFAGWTLVSTGVAWGVTDFMRDRRRLRNLLFPIALIVLGVAVLGGSTLWQRRAEQIGEAELRVREEIDALDPFARARVLRDVAGESLPLIRHLSSHN